MTLLNRFIYAWLTALLLLTSAQLSASPLKQINQLMAEREKLKSETRKIKEQTQINRAKIEQLKHRIKRLHTENKLLDQRILKEMQHYENKTHIIPNEEK